MNSDNVLPKRGAPDAVVFWGPAMMVGPALAVTQVAGWVLGVLGDVQSIIRPTMALELFASRGALFFPIAAFMAACRRWNEARASASVGWAAVAVTVMPIPG